MTSKITDFPPPQPSPEERLAALEAENAKLRATLESDMAAYAEGENNA
jgi:hypothetical protein